MKLDTICTVLDQLAHITSSKEKQKHLEHHLQDETFRKVVQYALDPYKRYGLRLPQDTSGRGTTLKPPIFNVLDDLATGALSGNYARGVVQSLVDVSEDLVGQLFARIINKDLRAGFTAKTVNKIRPGTVPEFNVMLAKKYEPRHVRNFPVQVEPKLDGVRGLTYVDQDVVQFFSRTGKQEFAEFPYIAEHLKSLDLNRTWFDGEIVTTSFNDTVSRVRQQKEPVYDAVLYTFDALTPGGFQIGSREGQVVRRHYLENRQHWFSDHFQLLDAYEAHSHDEIQQICESLWDQGYEGVVVKPFDGKWEPKRSASWLKIKAENDVDVRVTDVFEGTGKYQGMLGGLVVDVDGVECKVGGGFTDEQRQTLWQEPPIGRLVEVQYHEKTPDGSLRHPRFIRFRDDKDES